MGREDQRRRLCEALLKADGETTVIELLRGEGYWDRPELWRYYGDVENNWAQSGNQQSLAEAALAEKIVNAVDVRLIDKCRMNGVDPKSDDAPKSIRQAVARFFEGGVGNKIATGGRLEDWGENKIRQVAKGITLCATGVRGAELNITIADSGEGQSARRLPDTILSLNKSNKMYIPFVQGQFNQGGTGALRFCGEHNLQLVISRCNPSLLNSDALVEDREWCFTVVRRERPEGGRRNSIYTYLAPIGVGLEKKEREGDVLSFFAETFGIFPNDDGPYERDVPYGTAIKMFDYQFKGDRSNILRGRSILSRIDLLLPEIALPVRFYEYRKNQKGNFLETGSRRTTLKGLLRRLTDNLNVENGFPISVRFQPEGEKLIARIFAFVSKGEERDSGKAIENIKSRKLGGIHGYRKSEGVLFVRNGQTQGVLSKNFFRLDRMKMKPIADDLLVFVDCDELSDPVREDLFMPSRDRLVDNNFKVSLVNTLETALRECQQLRELRNRRQAEYLNDRLDEEEALSGILDSLIKNSPNLTTLLELGKRISIPFNTQKTGSDATEIFKGKFYPTYFKNKGVTDGEPLKRLHSINQRIRLTFETDAHDDYFTRPDECGAFDLVWLDVNSVEKSVSIAGPFLKNGIATIMFNLPEDVEIGTAITYIARTRDVSTSFENRALITPTFPSESNEGGDRRDRNAPNTAKGDDRERPMEVAPPKIDRIYRESWDTEHFDEFTAMKVEMGGYTKDEKHEIYVFKINMDNAPLVHEIKQKKLNTYQAKIQREQFVYANVLIGLSLLLDYKKEKKSESMGSDSSQDRVEDRIDRTCRAVAPFVPALVSLGASNFGIDDRIVGSEEVS